MIGPFLYIVVYFFMGILGVFCLRSIFRSYRLYKFKYILAFFVFILFDLLQGFFNFTFNYFFELASNLGLKIDFLPISMVYLVSIYALTYISLYLIIYILFFLSKIKIPRYILFLYFLWGVLSLSAYGFGLIDILKTNEPSFLTNIITSMNFLDVGFKLAIIVFFLYRIKMEKQKPVKIAFICLGLYFITLYSIALIYTSLRLDPWGFKVLLLDLFIYSIPLIFIKKFLIMAHGGSVLIGMYKTKLNNLTEKYQISKREKEIIYMILQGKSNKEIEKELFISQNTVKNHIYNIFQKTGVNSRAQLTRYFITDLERI